MTTSGPTRAETPTLPIVRRTAIGFIVGSALFAVGVPLSLIPSLPEGVSGWTYFTGSLFFTAAAVLQLVTACVERHGSRPRLKLSVGRVTFARRIRAGAIDQISAAVQLLGTLAFNISTFRAACHTGLSAEQQNRLVWRPDAIGSVLFLVSSALAMIPGIRARRHAHRRDRSWSIAMANLTGSIAFGISALGAHVLVSTGHARSARWDDIGTFAGAVLFLLGAALLLPPRHTHAATAASC